MARVPPLALAALLPLLLAAAAPPFAAASPRFSTRRLRHSAAHAKVAGRVLRGRAPVLYGPGDDPDLTRDDAADELWDDADADAALRALADEEDAAFARLGLGLGSLSLSMSMSAPSDDEDAEDADADTDLPSVAPTIFPADLPSVAPTAPPEVFVHVAVAGELVFNDLHVPTEDQAKGEFEYIVEQAVYHAVHKDGEGAARVAITSVGPGVDSDGIPRLQSGLLRASSSRKLLSPLSGTTTAVGFRVERQVPAAGLDADHVVAWESRLRWHTVDALNLQTLQETLEVPELREMLGDFRLGKVAVEPGGDLPPHFETAVSRRANDRVPARVGGSRRGDKSGAAIVHPR